MDERLLRESLCHAAHQLWLRGMTPGDSGMISVACHRRRYLITPPGHRRSSLRPEELVVVDVGGLGVNQQGSVDGDLWRPHRIAYQANGYDADADADEGVAATIFAAPPMTVALLRRCRDQNQIDLPAIGTVGIAATKDEQSIAKALHESRMVAIDSEGILTVGPDLPTVLNAIERLEHAATIELAASR